MIRSLEVPATALGKVDSVPRPAFVHKGKHPLPNLDSPQRSTAAARLAWVWLLVFLCLQTCAPPPQPPPPDSPRLVLFLVVDQGRWDYLDRVRPFLTGGLARLLDEGVSFDQAHHEHAVTYTAPGHATLATGLYPAHSGIIGNEWVDHESGEEVYCVDDERYGQSPRNLRGTTLGDWMRQRYPAAKVFAVSAKDRSAILTAGQTADGAYWFDRGSGTMVSSEFYPRGEAEWLEAFNDRRLPDERFGTPWEPLPVDPEAARAAGFEDLAESPFERSFPHTLGSAAPAPYAGFYRGYYSSPFIDELVAALAREIVEREGLGSDAVPDFLGLSFSALDAVGHEYGPDSLEVLDTLLRLDRLLGELFDRLDEAVGMDRVLVSFSSDHGVVPLPEVQALRGLAGRRVGAAEILCVQNAGLRLSERLGFNPWLAEAEPYLDRERLKEEGLEAAAVERQAAELIAGCPEVERVWTGAELAPLLDPASTPPMSWEERLFRNSYDPERSPDLMLQWSEYFLELRGRLTTHGSVWPYDTHVPLLVWGRGIAPRRILDPVATVDLAPTLAELLQVPVPTDLDGVSRAEWLAGDGDAGPVSP